MHPVIAIVGRPNVGKSTLFNKLTLSRDALVHDYPGVTRDRQYGQGRLGEKPFIAIDTGGLAGEELGLDGKMAVQAWLAVEEADHVLFIVDAKAGLTALDEDIILSLRKLGKPVRLVVNKIDGRNIEDVQGEFAYLGFANISYIAASQNKGILSLIQEVLNDYVIDDENVIEQRADGRIKVAVVGKPNVGKSTLINRILGEERVVAFDQAGTTTSSIYIPFERDGHEYTLIDTAGVRRKGKVDNALEKFSIIKTLQAIEETNVVILLIDAHEGLSEQDLKLIGFVIEAGKALVLVVNKWDGLDDYDKNTIKSEIDRRLGFVDFARLHYISALHGTGVGLLYDYIHEAYDSSWINLSSSKLTKILEDAITAHQPPLVKGRRIKLRYAHMGGQNPPIVIIHGNQTEQVPGSYKKYLINYFRKALKIVGTPIKIQFKTGDNPYEGKKNQLTDRQIQKKKRLFKRNK
ncbi:MAG: ribosome biogenesis GTPase Der [Legionellales bacterium]|nr:ribosome biogenesis GTPase Der [Legionellales bacterium]